MLEVFLLIWACSLNYVGEEGGCDLIDRFEAPGTAIECQKNRLAVGAGITKFMREHGDGRSVFTECEGPGVDQLLYEGFLEELEED